VSTPVSPEPPARPWRASGQGTGGPGVATVLAVAVTGLGSMPGTDPLEAARVVAGELPDFPFLPQLPARGAPSRSVGRTAGLLVGMPVDLQPSGWRLVDAPGRDAQRVAADLSADLDSLEEVFDGYRGPLKVSALGPLSLAAALGKNRGALLLADHGARRDLAQSLAAGLAAHVEGIRRRIPGARPVLQLDDLRLASVLAGDVATSSGFGRLRAVDVEEARGLLASVVAAVGTGPGLATGPLTGRGPDGVPVVLRLPAGLVVDADPTVERAAPPVLAVAQGSGVAAVAFDPARLATAAYDAVAELVESGVDLCLGAVDVATATRSAEHPRASPAGDRAGGGRPDPGGHGPDGGARHGAESAARDVLELWRALGFGASTMVGRVLLTPSGGLARSSPAAARTVLGELRETGHVLGELVEEAR